MYRRQALAALGGLAMTAAALLASPKLALGLARGGFGAHLLDVGSIRTIESEEFAKPR